MQPAQRESQPTRKRRPRAGLPVQLPAPIHTKADTLTAGDDTDNTETIQMIRDDTRQPVLTHSRCRGGRCRRPLDRVRRRGDKRFSPCFLGQHGPRRRTVRRHSRSLPGSRASGRGARSSRRRRDSWCSTGTRLQTSSGIDGRGRNTSSCTCTRNRPTRTQRRL